jgi:hypothetical protein
MLLVTHLLPHLPFVYTQSTQNMCLCIGDELHHPPTMNYTLLTPKSYGYA